MTGLPQNLIPNEPELKDLLDLHKKDIFLGLNCHAIATIQSFDPTQQTASATVNYKKTYFKPNAQGVYRATLVDYPQLIDCPVLCLGGGAGSLRFPIAAGDECLVLFNDRDLDVWFQGSSSSAVATPRLHSFSDAIIIVGIRSLANVLTDYDSVNPQIKAGGLTATFRIAGGARFENNIGWWDFKDDADIEFDTGTVVGLFGHGGHVKFQNSTAELIDTLCSIVNAVITATCATPGNPLVAPTLPALLTALQSFKEP